MADNGGTGAAANGGQPTGTPGAGVRATGELGARAGRAGAGGTPAPNAGSAVGTQGGFSGQPTGGAGGHTPGGAGGHTPGGAGGAGAGGSGGETGAAGDPFAPVNFPGCSTEFQQAPGSDLSWLFGGHRDEPTLDPVAGRNGPIEVLRDPQAAASDPDPRLEVTQPGVGCASERVLLARSPHPGPSFGLRARLRFRISGAHDLTAYRGVRFLVAEMSGMRPWVELALLDRASADADEGGTCSKHCDDPYRMRFRAFPTWSQQRVCFADLEPGEAGARTGPDLSAAIALRFTVTTSAPSDLFLARVALLPLTKGCP